MHTVAYKDLREFIALVEEAGSLRRIAGASALHEIGAITEVAAGMPDPPALLFDKIPGFAHGFRVFSNATTSLQRAALALGFDAETTPLEALKAWKSRRNELKPIPPRVVKDAPFLEHTSWGADVDLRQYPAPHWHKLDGGPYIGSGSLIITRDPDSGWINAAIYRVQVHGHNKVTIQFDHTGRHGSMIARKYWEKGKSCPVAIVNGQDPALFIAGFEYLPAEQSEYDFAGSIKGFPIDVVDGPVTGLPIPAGAEIVLEGELLPLSMESLSEGPFGEFTGYYAADAKPAPVMVVQASYHRTDPILFGSPPLKPPRFHFGLPFRAATLWSGLEQLGVTDVTGVWQHVSQLMTVVSLKQRYAGHAKRAALIAAANSYMGRIVVVVDDDIDPSNLADVMWAVTTRAEPSEQVDIVRNAWSSALDPRIPLASKQVGLTSHSKMIIDACRPFDQLESYPKTTALSIKDAQATFAKWGRFLQK
ncbi:UbiD family decarboxylase [Methylobacterium gnaphalii]|uniref:Decarboxylase UbiD n=1 Tax=Methylobacterium gnaphalii TaxID=1010610 RepID=A0A512JQ03_9HYPH|nr:UbiD family decarboxylase [Methylobacterium gnaphalii]GEP12027.1 decarboxylase UbiD [Methylobacterium gnaphalii]GJD71607.1 Phenolic acid decarboxylase [Methylobacterium gnaphalii]GLS51238.1 decarboxylase UbiD [Methylobacterium gnaphalii]